ncbi:hypothetical protein ONZ45_g17240 [Pleurotus djamor]|nr:hypothetical protein ONZ45_g17240 [Pleurotus djamor]
MVRDRRNNSGRRASSTYNLRQPKEATSDSVSKAGSSKRTFVHQAHAAPSQKIRKETVIVVAEVDEEDIGEKEAAGSGDNPDDDSTFPTNSDSAPNVNVDAEEDMSTLQQWTSTYRSRFLDELFRLEGRAGLATCPTTSHPSPEEGLYRCLDCANRDCYCQDCILERHKHLPLHRLQVWDEGHFASTSLATLGLIVQLGHGGGECRLPSDIRKACCIVDVTGHHLVNLRFCNCTFTEEYIQFFRFGWYPASTCRPRTAFTLDHLNTFHQLTLQGKLSAYDYCLSIERKTDNTGTTNVQSRYDQFLVCMRQYRHLRMIKRSGRGHQTEDISSVSSGALAVDCPPCPHPSINLPSDWETAPMARRWLYTLRLTVDANFRLKNRERGITHDQPLGDGWGHWVPNGPYKAYIAANQNEPEPNLCDSELKAVDQANSRRSNGYASTGIVAVVCARHGLVRRNGLGSLQKGERYVNTDFIIHQTLQDQPFARLCISYDIACQYSVNFATRNATFSSDLRLSDSAVSQITYVVPKFHLYAHGPKCQAKFNLNYILWSAETDCEDPERWWSHINPVSMSTKIMGPGSRVDTIDDHAAAWNWRKIVGMGTSFLSRFTEAIKLKARHRALHVEFSAAFSDEDVRAWPCDIQWPRRNPDEPTTSRESRREVSWIWRTVPAASASTEVVELPSDESVGSALRLEWTKSMARAKRWDEEVNLVVEEMRRTIAYLEWKRMEWYRTSANGRRSTCPHLNEGLGAYGYRQAAVFLALKDKFISMWAGPLAGHNFPLVLNST